MPTSRRRHAVTETPPVQRALDELRQELGTDRLEISELVILGAHEKLERLHAERTGREALLRQLADAVRRGDVPVDSDAAAEVRNTGWHRS